MTTSTSQGTTQRMAMFVKRTVAHGLVALTLLGGGLAGAAVMATPAHADEWSITGGWMNTVSHSRAVCAPGSVTVQMPSNDPYGTVRTVYLYQWNGYRWTYAYRAISATSNGYYYFRNGSAANSIGFLVGHGYYRVQEVTTYQGRIWSNFMFTAYYRSGAYTAPDVAWCSL